MRQIRPLKSFYLAICKNNGQCMICTACQMPLPHKNWQVVVIIDGQEYDLHGKESTATCKNCNETLFEIPLTFETKKKAVRYARNQEERVRDCDDPYFEVVEPDYIDLPLEKALAN